LGKVMVMVSTTYHLVKIRFGNPCVVQDFAKFRIEYLIKTLIMSSNGYGIVVFESSELKIYLKSNSKTLEDLGKVKTKSELTRLLDLG
jgi:hypothetical protein